MRKMGFTRRYIPMTKVEPSWVGKQDAITQLATLIYSKLSIRLPIYILRKFESEVEISYILPSFDRTTGKAVWRGHIFL